MVRLENGIVYACGVPALTGSQKGESVHFSESAYPVFLQRMKDEVFTLKDHVWWGGPPGGWHRDEMLSKEGFLGRLGAVPSVLFTVEL